MALHQVEVRKILSDISAGQPATDGFVPVFHTWDGKVNGAKLVLRTRSGACDRTRNPNGEFAFTMTDDFRKGVVLFKNTTGAAYCYSRTPKANWEGQGYIPGPFPGMLCKISLFVEGGYGCGGKWKQLSVSIVKRPSALDGPEEVSCVWGTDSGYYGACELGTGYNYSDEEIISSGEFVNPKNPRHRRFGIPRERAEIAARELGVTPEDLVTALSPYLERKLDEMEGKDLSHMTRCDSRATL